MTTAGIDSGTAAILNAAAPLFTVLFAAVAMHSERVTWIRLVGFLLGFAGVALVVGAEPGEGTGAVLGALAVVLAAAFYAVGALFTSSRLRGLSALEIALGTMMWATLLTLPPGLVALRQPEKGEAVGDRQRPLTKLDPAVLDTIEVTRAGAKAVVKKEGAKFKVTEPVAYAADETASKAAFDALTSLSLGDLVTENKAKHAEFEVDDAKAVHVVAKGGGKVLADFLVGKVSGTGTMLRLTGMVRSFFENGSRSSLAPRPKRATGNLHSQIPGLAHKCGPGQNRPHELDAYFPFVLSNPPCGSAT